MRGENKMNLNKAISSKIISILAGVFLAGSWASVANADDKLIEKGERVYKEVAGIGCAGCHGEYAEGDLGVGPFIRGADEGAVRAAVEGIGAMIAVKSVIKEDEIKAVSAYVNSLGQRQVIRTLAKLGRFLPSEFKVHPGTQVQFVVQNSSYQNSYTFKSDNLGVAPLKINRRSSGSFSWSAPAQEGSYTLYCTDCKLKDQFFTVVVDAKAKKFLGVKNPASKLAGPMTM
jgi:mono/diheme cytochrome c family protein